VRLGAEVRHRVVGQVVAARQLWCAPGRRADGLQVAAAGTAQVSVAPNWVHRHHRPALPPPAVVSAFAVVGGRLTLLTARLVIHVHGCKERGTAVQPAQHILQPTSPPWAARAQPPLLAHRRPARSPHRWAVRGCSPAASPDRTARCHSGTPQPPPPLRARGPIARTCHGLVIGLLVHRALLIVQGIAVVVQG